MRIQMNRQEPLTIQQVSLKFNIPKSTLRFWESELDGVVVSLRTHGGQRRYNTEHICIINEIKKLRDEGFSLVEIKRKLNNGVRENMNNSNSNKIDLLANRVAEVVKAEVHRFFESEELGGI
jgi:DNA-binding transcriptional MerR regulator